MGQLKRQLRSRAVSATRPGTQSIGVQDLPAASIVIPVHNGSRYLRKCLERLNECRPAGVQCIVVDDGSTDGSAEIARKFADQVISYRNRRGAAFARNRGVEAAKSELIIFLDSDVSIYPETIPQLVEALQDNPSLGALIGSYDDVPADPGFISQYRNLMHCYMHNTGRRRTCAFWTGCGAIRAKVFRSHGGFDENNFNGIEDVELGYRLRRSGIEVELRPEIQVTHLKRWRLQDLIRTDVLYRGVPWTELILRDRSLPNDLNLRTHQRVSVAMAWLIPVFLVWATQDISALGFIGLALTIIVLCNSGFYGFLLKRRGAGFLLGAFPLHVLFFFYSGLSFMIGTARHATGLVRRRFELAPEAGGSVETP